MTATAGKTAVAAVVRQYHEPMEMVEYPVPEPEPGALVVEMDRATVCGTDVHAWEGAYEGVLPIELPVVLGHEGVGRVTAIGTGAELDSLGQQISLGDRVIWTHEPCMQCWACVIDKQPTTCPTRRIGMFSTSAEFPHFCGTFAQVGYVWPRAGRVIVPEDVESTWASAASCALRTVVGVVERTGWIDYMDTVVIQGAGPLGLFSTALVACHSPGRLIVVGAPEDRLAVARQYGATDTISIEEHPDPAERTAMIRELSGGRGASVGIEASGAPDVVTEGLEFMAPNGRYVLVGSAAGAAQPLLAHRIVNKGLQVVGSFGGNIDSYFKALEFLRTRRDRFDWDLVVGKEYGLDQLSEAVTEMQSYRDIKPVIAPFGS